VEKYFFIAQIIIAVVLILVLLLQVRGGGLGGIFGQADSTFRTRRGLEKTLFQFTIVLVLVFIVLAVLSARWKD
jgi:preprotein translocase subunit SecG